MDEKIVRKIWETVAQILSEREGIKITITDVRRKESLIQKIEEEWYV